MSRNFLNSIVVGNTSRCRLSSHYQQTLSHDLLYSLYSPPSILPNPLSRSPIWSPSNPYAINRAPPRPKGNRYLVPNQSSKIPILEFITIESMSKSILTNKNNLLPLIMSFQAITGQSLQSNFISATGPNTNKGILITKSSKKSASFKIRPGAATGIKLTLKGQPMYQFLETLTEFVLPRLKTFTGIPLPSTSHPSQSPSSTGGVVQFGLPSEAMGLFPSIELNLDQYGGKLSGFNVHCGTSARGRGAQDKARALLSGLGVVFVKK